MSYKKKRIVFYSQHLIGVGHHFRNRQIVQALSQSHEVHLIDGGRQIRNSGLPKSVNIIELEPIFLDTSSGHLVPEDPTQNILNVLVERRRILSDVLTDIRPDVFIVELFPFGRRELRLELLPAIQIARSFKSHTICSLRDIPMRAKTATLFEPSFFFNRSFIHWIRGLVHLAPFNNQDRRERCLARQYYEQVTLTLNTYFDFLLVHGDPKVASIEEFFPWMDDITIPVLHTGYVSEKPNRGQDRWRRPNKNTEITGGFVLVSAGGGLDGYELIVPCIQAWKDLYKRGVVGNRKMIIFSGPFIKNNHYKTLERICPNDLFHLQRFATDFLQWMQVADFSISRAGYNTCMNVLETRTQALLVPSQLSEDQIIRAQRLADMGLAEVLNPKDITPKRIAKAIQCGLTKPRVEHNISLDGAERTNAFVSNL